MVQQIPAPTLGWWYANGSPATSDGRALADALRGIERPIKIVRGSGGECALAEGGVSVFGPRAEKAGGLSIVAYVPGVRLESLGNADFRNEHKIRYAYMAGSMANGIASVELVSELARAGFLASFGSAGLAVEQVESAIDRLQRSLGTIPHAVNLIHSPGEPALESAVVDLFLRRAVRLVEASAFLKVTLPLVRYALAGIDTDPAGNIVRPNRVIGKVSRVEVASQFFAPADDRMIDALVQSGDLTRRQADLARQVPIAGDVTAEADSGGHTDNRPAIALLPTLVALRDRMQVEGKTTGRPRVGLAGGLGTPAALAAAFAMGADYVVVGSVHQACLESGSSPLVRQMLAEARQADVIMAPAADMFEMGVKVQVLKRGTMFAMRAAKLHELYRTAPSLDALPASERATIEKQIFRAPLETIWDLTRTFFQSRDPGQIERAERDPKHKMALVFRWYLGQSSRWATRGEVDRKIDFQVWCGPAMGAFNEWTRGSFLEEPANRKVVDVAVNLLHGAAVLSRIGMLRCQGVPVPDEAARVVPVPVAHLRELGLVDVPSPVSDRHCDRH